MTDNHNQPNDQSNFEADLAAKLRAEANNAPAGPGSHDVMAIIARRSQFRMRLAAAASILLLAALSSISLIPPEQQGTNVFLSDGGGWMRMPLKGQYNDGYVMVQVSAEHSRERELLNYYHHWFASASPDARANPQFPDIDAMADGSIYLKTTTPGPRRHPEYEYWDRVEEKNENVDVRDSATLLRLANIRESREEQTGKSGATVGAIGEIGPSAGEQSKSYWRAAPVVEPCPPVVEIAPDPNSGKILRLVGKYEGGTATFNPDPKPVGATIDGIHFDGEKPNGPVNMNRDIRGRFENIYDYVPDTEKNVEGEFDKSAFGIGGHPSAGMPLEGWDYSNGQYRRISGTEVAQAEMNRIYNSKSGELWSMPVLDGDDLVQHAAPFSLKHTGVNVEISGYVASTTMTQVFHNPFDDTIEAIYVFPLPEDAAVNDFAMTVGGRKVIGMIRKRAEARQIYEQARDMGYTAALLEQERPNIFQQSVANIAPGADVSVDITFFNRLKYADGVYEYVLPMVVAPRYPGHVYDYDAITPEYLPSGVRSGNDISVNVDLDAGMPIDDFSSPTHQLEYRELDANHYQVRLSHDDEIPNRDFVLRYSVIGDQLQTGVVVHSADQGGFVSLMFAPPSNPAEQDISPRELTFILDVSGSMGGAPIDMSKEIITRTLDRMRWSDTFNIFYFAGSNAQMWETPKPNTLENVEYAKRFLDNIEAGGGTEMLAGLQRLFDSERDPSRLRMVMFLTDGEVGNETEILKAVRANVKDSRFFCFGVGSSVNHYLIQGIGKHGRGAASTVLTNSLSNAEELRKPIDEFIGFIDAPVLTDITIDWGGLDVTDPNPELIADVFKGKPVTVIAQYHTAGSGVITINARKGGVPWSYTIPVTLPFNEPDNAALAPIWARAKIERLTDERVLSTEERSAQIGEEIIQTALDFRLVSEGTSFVAVDDMTIIGSGRPRTVKVAVDKPLDHAGE